MKPTFEDSALIAAKILEAETKLEYLQYRVDEIGLPAAQELKRRVDALKIEACALKRNFEESRLRGEPGSLKMEKIETLLGHIEREESSVEHEAQFLNNGAPSTMTLAVEAGAQLVGLYRRGVKHIIGNAHPLGESVFVNHSHENLESDYGLEPVEKPNT
jgi:hypothetical protein